MITTKLSFLGNDICRLTIIVLRKHYLACVVVFTQDQIAIII